MMCLRLVFMLLMSALLAACGTATPASIPPNSAIACTDSYTKFLNKNIAIMGGSSVVQGRYQTFILPIATVFDGHSANLTHRGAIILENLKPRLVCEHRWVLRITIYNAMFESRRASRSLARQQGKVVLTKLWQPGLTVGGVMTKVSPEKCYQGCAQQNFIEIVTKH